MLLSLRINRLLFVEWELKLGGTLCTELFKVVLKRYQVILSVCLFCCWFVGTFGANGGVDRHPRHPLATGMITYRACRFFLGVGKRTPNAAVQGEMGWTVPWQHQWLCTSRSWCRLSCMNTSRLHKKVFMWTCQIKIMKWAYRCTDFFQSTNLH